MNHISIATVDDLLIQQFNHNFTVKASEETYEMLREDTQFMESVNKTVKRI